MYLKKIELFGFKSFANKTELVFEPGVTAIVGPNGCGKSNISDAIKWVLGEQSAKELRGSKMEDVIFNGTDNSQPVNLAEISLTFSNKDHLLPVDYEEVIITRRIFRSGESEYLLNKTPVRLKDILDLLAGTGIGVSSYSIAEQGKMDRVLNARPEDRREIFEEASGITKYKNKKREALQKLEHTEVNLTRLADIINEVRRQITSIERQAQKAEKFRVEFEKLKEVDIKLAFHEYSRIKKEDENVKQQNETLKQKEAHLSLELNLQMDELRLYREKISSLEAKISEARMRDSSIIGTVDKNENAVRIYKENIEELKRRSQSLAKEIEDIGKRTFELRQKIEGVEFEFNIVNGEREGKQALVSETEKNLQAITETIKNCEKTISESKFAIMDNVTGQSKFKNDFNKVSAAINTASSRHRRLNIEKDNITREMQSIEQRLGNTVSSVEEQKVLLDGALSKLSALRKEGDALNKLLIEKTLVIDSLRQRLTSASSKLELLKDLKEKREGFSEGVKAYLEFLETNAKAKSSFIGILADMIRPQDGFTAALEAVLKERSQLIVVKTREAVTEALKYLQDKKKGRAEFIAIDEVLSASSTLKELESPSIIGRLQDYVAIKEEFKPLLKYILKDCYLVDDIDKDASLRTSHTILVTKEATVADGIITCAGTSGREDHTSIIGRDAKIRELSVETNRLSQEIASCETERSEIVNNIGLLETKLKQAEDVAKKEEIRLHSKESELAKVSEDKEKVSKEISVIELELEEVIEEESGLKEKEGLLKSELEKLEAEHQRLDLLINESQNTITTSSSQKEKIIVAVTELRTQLSLIDDRYKSQDATLNMLRDSLREGESDLELRKSQLEEANNKSSSLNIEIERLSEENKVLSSQRIIIDEELVKLQEEKRTAVSVAEEVDANIRNKQRDVDELRSGISTFHINITEFSYKANSIKEKIQQLYKVNLDAETIFEEPSWDWGTMEQEAKELREKIDRMGPVNLVAIEEHKELQDRYNFLTSQQQDLLNAKESLHQAINKINRTTRKMFIDTFEQIKIAFKDYFRLLFGGGTAELFLMDQADILESGIEIVVRPPGKKLQTISLLSGGEKALTAVALLFALFKVRPTPFCVLDEIDAPLDEANIERFSRILGEFIKTTQFIIITHNKKTIAVSDIMYGITMEESGISKIVSVKFSDTHKTPAEPKATSRPQGEEEPARHEEIASETLVAEPAVDNIQSP